MSIGLFEFISTRLARSASAVLKKIKSNPVGPIWLTIVCAVLLSVIVTIGTILFLYNVHNRELISNEKTLSNTALIVAGEIEDVFNAVRRVQEEIIDQTKASTNLGEDGFERDLSRYDFYMKLRDKASGMPYVGSLTIISAHGGLVNFSRKWPTPEIDSTDREYFKAFQSDPSRTSFIGEPVHNHANGTWVIQLARKISGPNGEFLGLTTAAIDLEYLQRFFNQIAAEPGSGISLLRADGTLIVRSPRIESNIGRRFPSAQAVKLVSDADSGVGVGVGAVAGVARIVAAHRVGSYPVLVASTKTTEIAFTNWQQTATHAIFAAALAIIAIAAFAILFIKMLNKQQALAKAQAERDLAEQFRDQSVRLDTALNNMSQGLAMFDSSERLILCNQRYMNMYGLPADAVKPGHTLRELLHSRQAQGAFAGDVEKYRLVLLQGLALGKTRTATATNSLGQSFHIVNVPMAGGGWVATHEDVTEKLRAETMNEQQQFQLDTALKNMMQGLCLFDGEQRLIVCNKRYAELYGLNDEYTSPGTELRTILEHRVARGTAPVNHESYINDRIADVAKNKPFKTTDILIDGRYIAVVHRPTKDGGWVTTHEDVTEPQRAEQELAKTKQFLDSIITNIPIAIVVKDAKTHKFVLTNREFEETLGLVGKDLVGKTAFDIFGAKDAERLDKADSECVQSKSGLTIGEFEVDNPLLGQRILNAKRIVIRDSQDYAKYLVLVIDDVTERRKSEQRIAFMAHHDALTGLANRVTVVQKIEEAAARHRRRGEPFSVLLLDLDRFKQVNDTLGHSAGDILLREMAARLKGILRETDVLARLGGDEFAIVQPGETNQREAARTLADRVIESVAKPFNIEGDEVNIGVSIGISLAPDDATNPDNLLKMADLALYCAKSAGRNCYQFFDPAMSTAASARHELESDLRRAIQQNELELFYQPIIDTKTSRICGAEALLRWQHPIKGTISPDQFIPIAEETGLITQIGEWVLHTACVDAASWPDNVKLAVNLSPAQFRKTDLLGVVMYALAESGLPPERLELEITETALIEEAAECLPVLRQLKNLGIAVALDDFGTGYSSLSQLTIFPFDKIKIDRSFIHNMTKRAECAAIISATMTMTQTLGIATTAEGVETVDQYRLLRLAGVTSLQGYLFKRPCPVSEIDFDCVYDCPNIEDAA